MAFKLQYFLRICTWCTLLFPLGACEQTPVYQRTIALPEAQWPTALLPEFRFTIRDEALHYDVYLLAEAMPDYPFQNLHVTYYLKDEAAEVLQQCLQDCPLFDAKTGEPLGQRCAWALLTDYQFSQPGTYTIQLEQFMRMAVLPGLKTVGIRIIRHE